MGDPQDPAIIHVADGAFLRAAHGGLPVCQRRRFRVINVRPGIPRFHFCKPIHDAAKWAIDAVHIVMQGGPPPVLREHPVHLLELPPGSRRMGPGTMLHEVGLQDHLMPDGVEEIGGRHGFVRVVFREGHDDPHPPRLHQILVKAAVISDVRAEFTGNDVHDEKFQVAAGALLGPAVVTGHRLRPPGPVPAADGGLLPHHRPELPPQRQQ